MDVLARTTMKDAANCDTQCELQNSVNHQTAERERRCWGFFLAARLFQCLLIPQKVELQAYYCFANLHGPQQVSNCCRLEVFLCAVVLIPFDAVSTQFLWERVCWGLWSPRSPLELLCFEGFASQRRCTVRPSNVTVACKCTVASGLVVYRVVMCDAARC